MKTIAITSKTSMNVPSTFTMKELRAANPTVTNSNTLYQRVQSLLKQGDESPIYQVGDVKRGTKAEGEKVATLKKGRTEIVYALKDASENNNLIRQVKAQGIAKAKKAQGVTIATVDSSTPDVPVISDVAVLPEPSASETTV